MTRRSPTMRTRSSISACGRRVDGMISMPTHVVDHPRSGFGGLWRQYRNYGSGRARTARRHS